MDKKRCSKCGEVKPLDEFTKDRSNKCGRSSRCKICEHERSRKYRAAHLEEEREYGRKYRAAHPEEKKARSHEWYATHREKINNRAREYYRTHPGIQQERTRKYIAAHPGKKREWRLKGKYNLSPDDYNAMLTKQQGRCAICGRDGSENKPLIVDHDHKSGKVRGLICKKCNTGLGQFQDDISMLLKAVEYLRAFENVEK